MVFTTLDDSLQLGHAGFTTNKMRMLERNYLVPESIAAAVKLWDSRVSKAKYGSVGFSTYGHYVKGHVRKDPTKVSRASVMGPCIQGVTLTLIDKRRYAIDVFYRTTELYKKFPADLVFLRDTLLKPFKTHGLTLDSLTCHFANVTVHPMYWVTIAPHLTDPAGELAAIKDEYFRAWLIKWSARYVCTEYSRGIQKFSQALRVRGDVMSRLSKPQLKSLQKYLRSHHPGHRSGYNEESDDDE